jgi:hypothetical protein
MRLNKYHYVLLLLLLIGWVATSPQPASPDPAAHRSDHPEVYPIARVYRQQIEEQIASSPLTFAGPRPVEVALAPAAAVWPGEDLFVSQTCPDRLYTQMSLQW